ncbi:hypothetical protein L5G32_18920 [Gordonia sp. HY002]|uniref:hypothetical protein n=1 Tax=Gordonia zhenghanii TaxID=2911516 RepID=UPI001EEF9A79|nr:hypothetical protein [Gordonia zhenghanii]MCF8572332.1 hypothetical protein [Gordonia zhenghanii]MCF8607308.1 hypothetical protein [Gordonia zhenghanii]
MKHNNYAAEVPEKLRPAYDAAPGVSLVSLQNWVSLAHDEKYPRDPERANVVVVADGANTTYDADDYHLADHLRRMEYALNTITEGDAQ